MERPFTDVYGQGAHEPIDTNDFYTNLFWIYMIVSLGLIVIISIFSFRKQYAPGPQGKIGEPGIEGPTGRQGFGASSIGPTGPSGFQGIQGQQGDSGPSGIVGKTTEWVVQRNLITPGASPSLVLDAINGSASVDYSLTVDLPQQYPFAVGTVGYATVPYQEGLEPVVTVAQAFPGAPIDFNFTVPAGAPGDQGNQGNPGPKGETGPTGPIGDIGFSVPGLRGVEGATGPTTWLFNNPTWFLSVNSNQQITPWTPNQYVPPVTFPSEQIFYTNAIEGVTINSKVTFSLLYQPSNVSLYGSQALTNSSTFTVPISGFYHCTLILNIEPVTAPSSIVIDVTSYLLPIRYPSGSQTPIAWQGVTFSSSNLATNPYSLSTTTQCLEWYDFLTVQDAIQVVGSYLSPINSAITDTYCNVTGGNFVIELLQITDP